MKINAVPVSNNTHRLPINLRNKLKCEPNKLEANRIMSEVNELTKWVNRLVIVEKKNYDLN